MDRGYKVNREIHPKDTASIASLLTFRYIHKFIRRGNRKDLQEHDVPKLWKKFRIKKMRDECIKAWSTQLESRKKTSVTRLMISCFLRKYLLIGVTLLIAKTVDVLIVPYCLGEVINFFKVGQIETTHKKACYYGIIVILTNIFYLVFENQYILYKVEFGMVVFTSLCSLVYTKVLRLSSSKISEISSGKIVGAITKDIPMIEESLYDMNDIWIEAIQGVVVFYLLLNKVGIAAIVGIGCYVVTMIIQAIIAKTIYAKRKSVNLESDKRYRLIQEVLTSIRIVKMYTWENFFSNRVTSARDQEVKKFGIMTFIKFFTYYLGSFCDKMSFFAMLLFYLYLGNNLTAEVVYYSEMCLKKISILVTFIMTNDAHYLAEFFACIHRLDVIMNADEYNPSSRITKHSVVPKIEFTSANIGSNDEIILKNVNLKIGPGFSILAGPMGCGKSVLLKAILGEYTTIDGKIDVEGQVSFASQKPWIFPASIRQNILFGLPYDDMKYKKVIEICALSFDLKRFTDNDETIINDCDINLSKGQQARINLARALYKDSDIYTLDDPLSSLDYRVQNHIFQELRKYLKHKLVILASHDDGIFNMADNVIVMSNGMISCLDKSVSPITRPVEYLTANGEENLTALNIENDCNFHLDSSSEDSKLKTASYTAEFANIYHEEQDTGAGLGWLGYRDYLKYGGGTVAWVTVLALYISVEATSGSSEKLLSKWVEVEENYTSSNQTLLELSNFGEGVVSNGRMSYATWYTCLVLMSCSLVTASAITHLIFQLKISRNLHKTMINRVIRATMSFFDKNMSGTILNRFSKDVYLIDDFLPFVIIIVIKAFTALFSTAVLISSVNAGFTIFTLVLAIILYSLCRYFMRPIRSFKKMENSTRSPMVGHLNATLDGLVTIRACGVQKVLTEEFHDHLCVHLNPRHLFEICFRCLAFSMSIFSTTYTSLIIVWFLAAEADKSSAAVGLAITQSFALSSFFNHAFRHWVTLEFFMVCFQRTQEYTKLKQENQSGQIVNNWPSEGQVEFQNVHLTYKSGCNSILRNLNFTIRSRERIGVVGRTGAGKSSLISTLFRLYDIEGKILIDDIDIKTVPLDYLRNQITIMSQDPLTFSGSIRDNIDPAGKYSDNQIWSALSDVNLRSHIRSLDDDITDSSISYSIGQKQLICLARAVIKKTKIVVLDEATSNMDEETATFIHNKIEELFTDCTLLIIAHRLNSVMNCDRVLVMNAGEIIELDNPKRLMKNNGSTFFKMVNNLSDY